jgi:hypothetical protein
MTKLIDIIFICSSVVFNILVSALYIAFKFGDLMLVEVLGGIALSLIVPFTVTLLGYLREKAKKRTIIFNGIILIYLLLELLLDYLLRIHIKEILAINLPFVIVFFAALFSMIYVSYERNKKIGNVVIITNWILLGCFTYYLLA